MTDRIPPDLAKRHGGDKLEEMGKKWSETFELWGGLRPDDSILDIGCGPGRMAKAIGDRFGWRTPNYVGFDITRPDIEFAKNSIGRQHPQFSFHCVDAHNDLYRPAGEGKTEAITFPAADRSISFCFATSIFTHFYKSEISHYIHETYRCLQSDGRFFSTWFLLEDGMQAANPRFKFPFDNEDGTRSETETSRREAMAIPYNDVVTIFRDAGFEEFRYHRGAWRRDEKQGRHAQDTIVVRKPAS